jgi:hypothetical protein
MPIADGELRNLLNGATLRFRRRYTRQNRIVRYLTQRLYGGKGKKQTQVRSAVQPNEKPNPTKKVGNVMDEPGHTSELHV